MPIVRSIILAAAVLSMAMSATSNRAFAKPARTIPGATSSGDLQSAVRKLHHQRLGRAPRRRCSRQAPAQERGRYRRCDQALLRRRGCQEARKSIARAHPHRHRRGESRQDPPRMSSRRRRKSGRAMAGTLRLYSVRLTRAGRNVKKHLDLTTGEVVGRLEHDWDADIRSYDAGHRHMLMFADTLSEGIAKQFPDKIAASK